MAQEQKLERDIKRRISLFVSNLKDHLLSPLEDRTRALRSHDPEGSERRSGDPRRPSISQQELNLHFDCYMKDIQNYVETHLEKLQRTADKEAMVSEYVNDLLEKVQVQN